MFRSRIVTLMAALALALVAGAEVTAMAASADTGRTSPGNEAARAVVDINSAGVGELETLPGIGPALAKRIVQFRDEHGAFKSVEELLVVKGIGPRLLEKLRSRIRVGRTKGSR
ncbi:MAG: helix-hairpin-helix domain-containing protein [Acidobacteriota bacterium]|nr:helix-hairpin-helix domain-containing protein [Acidobacteriota bacterium]